MLQSEILKQLHLKVNFFRSSRPGLDWLIKIIEPFFLKSQAKIEEHMDKVKDGMTDIAATAVVERLQATELGHSASAK